MRNNKNFYYRYQFQFGFSIADIMIVTAVIAIISTVSTPNIKKMIYGYKLKIASTDLTSYIRRSKMGAAKDNSVWTINFDPIGFTGYQVKDGSGRVIANINFDSCNNDANIYTRCYNGDILYQNPADSTIFDQAILRFQPTGLTDQGYAFLSNKLRTHYHRIGLESASGILSSKKWDGSRWE